MKFKFIDILLFSLLFIFVIAFPVNLLGLDLFYQTLLSIGLKVLLLAYYIYILCRYHINIFKFANYRRALLFIPFLLACFSNIIALKISGVAFYFRYDPALLSLFCINALLVAINEELLFRLFIQNSLIFASSIKRVLASAGIFALFHLLAMVNISSLQALTEVATQVVYAFGLGLILGFLYEYTYSLPLCIFFHLSFNIFNSVLIEKVYGFEPTNQYILSFYMTAVVIGVLLVGYGLFLYFFILKRNERYFRE